MKPELLSEMEESFKKHLPAQLTETLQKELKRLQECEKRMNELEKLCNSQRETISSQDKRIQAEQELSNREHQLSVALKDLEKRERNLEIESLKYQLESEKGNKSFAQNVALGLVRNTVYRDNVYKNDTIIPEWDSSLNKTINKKTGETEMKTTNLE